MRKNQRFHEALPVQYFGKGIIGQGLVKDLSMTGGQIVGDIQVSPGIVLSLRVSVPGEKEPFLIDPTFVQWTKGREFGVEFDTLPEKFVKRIRRTIASFVQKQHGESLRG
jgi:hypothetical protein